MNIERLDGFTADGFGNVIEGEPQDGDVVRIEGIEERRYYEPKPVEPEVAKPKTTLDDVKSKLAELTLLVNAL